MACAIESLFGARAEALPPVPGLLLDIKQTVDEVLAEGGLAIAELLPRLSAAQLAGVPRRGKRAGEVLWYGSQAGRISLSRAQSHLSLHVVLKFLERVRSPK
jgi:hypothetical protein